MRPEPRAVSLTLFLDMSIFTRGDDCNFYQRNFETRLVSEILQ